MPSIRFFNPVYSDNVYITSKTYKYIYDLLFNSAAEEQCFAQFSYLECEEYYKNLINNARIFSNNFNPNMRYIAENTSYLLNELIEE